jgi:hypothetical protein
MEISRTEKGNVELSVLKTYGLRYSILAAWEEELRSKGITLVPNIAKPLEAVRVKISSGCFSVCEVGCDLGRIEAHLLTAASSAGVTNIDDWLSFLGECMSETADFEAVEKKIPFPAVKMHYNRFDFSGACKCD